MTRWANNQARRAATVALALSLVANFAADAGQLADTAVRVRIVENEQHVGFVASEAFSVATHDGPTQYPAGNYTISLMESTPTVLRYHVFGKTFLPGEDEAERAFIAMAKGENFPVRVIEQGLEMETNSGRSVDTRMRLVSIGFFAERSEADAFKKELAEREMWSWVQHEVVSAGRGTAELTGPDGNSITLAVPFSVSSDHPIEFENVDTGFWSENRKHQRYAGDFDFAIGLDGGIDVVESLDLETYLHGVLPAEMPPEWPLETLKAQAVAARSEVLSNLAKKHLLEGFDFCGVEHCRAYLGSADREDRVIEALEATRGEFLVHDGQIVPTVFSATCGGWTEDNETVWSGRAQPALRGVADVAKRKRATAPEKAGLAEWLRNPPKSWCDHDENYFRWSRSFTAAELTAIVNKRHTVGTVRRVEAGERGVSGRLKWVRIVGTAKSLNVYKELPIRQTFGGLPSALFVIIPTESGFTLRGAGRGHGVGLCQNGARAMADAGKAYDTILTHYFSGTAIESFR